MASIAHRCLGSQTIWNIVLTMPHKLIELCKNASVPINLALLAWSVYMLQSDTPVVTGIRVNWKAAYSLVAITSGTVLATRLFQWIQNQRPSRRFKALQSSIRECLEVVESNVDIDLPEDREQDIDSTHLEVVARHKLFNELARLGITLPDASRAKDTVKFLLHIALYSQEGKLCEARKFSRDLEAGKVFFE